MLITALKKQIKNSERVSVFVDEKYSFSLNLDELVTQGLKKDQELSEAELKRLKKISDDGKLRARSLEWLLNRPHSVREFKDYLYRKKADPAFVEKLIMEFAKRGYLNDHKYALWLVELRGRSGKSNRALKNELFKKGIAREVIEEAVATSGDETERLKIIIAKKRKLSRYKNDDLKLKQYLLQQGFSYQLVNETLKNT